MPEKGIPAYFLGGPTAGGKTAVAHVLARRMKVPILSADSMLVYRGMDVGTAKPTLQEREGIPYFGIDLVTPAEEFNTARWLEAAGQAAREGAFSHGVLVVGGTGLYHKLLMEGLSRGAPPSTSLREQLNGLLSAGGVEALQQELHRVNPQGLLELADPSNPRRLIRAIENAVLAPARQSTHVQRASERCWVVALRWAREMLVERIEVRVKQMFDQGLVGESERLEAMYPDWSLTARQAIGYAEVAQMRAGQLDEADARDRIAIRTRQLAKRQMTWLRNQHLVHWLDVANGFDPEPLADKIQDFWRARGPCHLFLPTSQERA